jgi:hypothetical protein
MEFAVDLLKRDGSHHWAVLSHACNLQDDTDKLVLNIIEAIRHAYGEQDIIRIAQPDPSVASRFNIDAITKVIRLSLPDPDVEDNKPEQLTNYRSESTELIARSALMFAHNIEFPASPQKGKTNQNQPVLGFDGWGFLKISDDDYALVLVQVKGCEDNNHPPGEAKKLATECTRIPKQQSAIARALSVIALQLENTSFSSIVMKMLEEMASGSLPVLVVSPVIVRGSTLPHIDDLQPVMNIFTSRSPFIGRGVVVSIGARLGDFGREVMSRARLA